MKAISWTCRKETLLIFYYNFKQNKKLAGPLKAICYSAYRVKVIIINEYQFRRDY